MDKKLGNREQKTLEKLKRNRKGSGLLLNLFHRGYTNISAVLVLMKLNFPKYKEKEWELAFREFWLGIVRTQEMLDELDHVVKQVRLYEEKHNDRAS